MSGQIFLHNAREFSFVGKPLSVSFLLPNYFLARLMFYFLTIIGIYLSLQQLIHPINKALLFKYLKC